MPEYRRGAHTVSEMVRLLQWLKGKTAHHLPAEQNADEDEDFRVGG